MTLAPCKSCGERTFRSSGTCFTCADKPMAETGVRQYQHGSYFEDVVAWDQATGVSDDLDLRWRVLREEYLELAEALARGDLVETADACADLIWTVCGLANALNIPFDAIWSEVRRSNFDKVGPDGQVLRREDGKILKPDGWTPPDIEGVLERAGVDA